MTDGILGYVCADLADGCRESLIELGATAGAIAIKADPVRCHYNRCRGCNYLGTVAEGDHGKPIVAQGIDPVLGCSLTRRASRIDVLRSITIARLSFLRASPVGTRHGVRIT